MTSTTRPPVRLTPGKRVLFLTKDAEQVRRQIHEGLDLRMEDLKAQDLLDDINTDAMTPAWVCFDHLPQEIAKNAYAGLVVNKKRQFAERALIDGNFEVIVSGQRKGVGSSRETAAQCEKYSGIRIAIASSFAPIHARNNINLGTLMGDHALLVRLQRGEAIPFDEFTKGYDAVTKLVIEHGGLFPFSKALAAGQVKLPKSETAARPMTMAEKILANHLVDTTSRHVKPGDPVVARVDGGYSHEFTTAQVHQFLADEYGEGYSVTNPSKFAVFEDHLIYADEVQRMRPFM
jgi:3-isopropylmalate/(R)-2-methylmalate dehydratase large subunit